MTDLSSARDEAWESPNGPSSARVTTPPAATVPSTQRARVASLVWRAGERAMTSGEERLPGPGRREMKPETSDTSDDAPRDFEQVETNRADGRRGQMCAREDRPAEIREQQQCEAVQLQATRVGAKAMTAEAIGVDVELELLDPILRRAAGVIPRDEIGRAAAAIGDHEAHVEACRCDIDLDQNPPGMWPRLRAMPKAGANVNRPPASLVPSLRLRDQRGHARLEDAIRADAEHVIDALRFELGFDRRRRHSRVPAQENRRVRKPPAQRRQEVPQLVDDPGRTRIPPGTQPRPQQESGAAFEPDERVVHVLVVPAMKQRELLRPVGRIIGAVEIENEIGRVR
jgi:hypothetical protein